MRFHVVRSSAVVNMLLTATSSTNPDNSIDLIFSVPEAFLVRYKRSLNQVATGTPVPQIQLTVLINGVDVSTDIVSSLSIDWSEESAGVCSFVIRGQSPFDVIPTLNSSTNIKEGNTIKIVSNITLGDTTYNHTLFTGYILNFTHDLLTDLTSVQCMDKSYFITRPGDRLYRTFYEANPAREEIVTCLRNNTLYSDYAVKDDDVKNILGVWESTDVDRKVNLLTDSTVTVDVKYAIQVTVTIGTRFQDITGRFRTLWTLTPKIQLQDGRIVNPLIAIAAPDKNYVIKYLLNPTDQNRIKPPALLKSEHIKSIVRTLSIPNVIIEREKKIEDEYNSVDLIANGEFPLDFLRKIILPQAWKADFTPEGNLRVFKPEVKNIPDYTYTDSDILYSTGGGLTISKESDNVINRQAVSGVVVITPGAALPTESDIDQIGSVDVINGVAGTAPDNTVMTLIKTITLSDNTTVVIPAGNVPQESDIDNAITNIYTSINIGDWSYVDITNINYKIAIAGYDIVTLNSFSSGSVRTFSAYENIQPAEFYTNPIYFDINSTISNNNVNWSYAIRPGNTQAIRDAHPSWFSGLSLFTPSNFTIPASGVFKLTSDNPNILRVALGIVKPKQRNSQGAVAFFGITNGIIEIYAPVKKING